ncbi:hypothetical protein DSQ35_0716 [Campylobacter jejuni]|nr:hypothetical protein DSQ35_0716 [Campylobacter jejuni]
MCKYLYKYLVGLKMGGGEFSNHPKVKSIFLGLHKLLLDVLHRV